MNNKQLGKLIKILMAERRIKRKDFAKELGISYNTLTTRLQGKTEFTTNEILKMQKIFNIDPLTLGLLIFYGKK